jgi:hypothetical protein
MKKIVRGSGITPSEKYLAKLADKTFLNLWSYPNLFINKKEGGTGVGKKELCDLLVVCGDDIIIFSDKSIEWQKTVDFHVAWSRWYRRAVEKSVAQICKVERWLVDFADRIFLDPECRQRFPIELPPAHQRRVHGIVVALGVNQACSNHYGSGSGTLPVVPTLKGKDHTDSTIRKHLLFGIGDVSPEGSFIHVFDDLALDLLMKELDTVSDFTRYLTRRERIIRSGRLLSAPGEEDLVGYYLQSEGPNNEHDFIKPGGGAWKDGDHFAIGEGMYAQLIQRPEYHAKRSADEISCMWDRLIEQFTGNILAGTSVSSFDEPHDAADAEKALRTMALETRVRRRMLGEALIAAMKNAEKQKAERFCRVVLPGPNSADRKIAYLFLIVAYPAHLNLAGGYEQYRKVRVNMLHAYCLRVFSDNRHLKRVVGIGFDASSTVTGRKGGSEDLLALEVSKWTEELEEQARELSEKFDIMKPERIKRGVISAQEYPAAAQIPPSHGLSRQHRRALERARHNAERGRR